MNNEERRNLQRETLTAQSKKNMRHSKCLKYFRFLFVEFAVILLLLFSFACKTIIEEPIFEPEPETVTEKRCFVVFNMTSNPTTGYDWEPWIHYDSTGRFAVNNVHREDIYPGAMGSPQRQAVTLRSAQAGRVYVHFIYKRPWIGGQDIGRYIYTFDIAEDLTIKLLDSERSVKQGYTEDSLPVIEPPEIRNQ